MTPDGIVGRLQTEGDVALSSGWSPRPTLSKRDEYEHSQNSVRRSTGLLCQNREPAKDEPNTRPSVGGQRNLCRRSVGSAPGAGRLVRRSSRTWAVGLLEPAKAYSPEGRSSPGGHLKVAALERLDWSLRVVALMRDAKFLPAPLALLPLYWRPGWHRPVVGARSWPSDSPLASNVGGACQLALCRGCSS